VLDELAFASPRREDIELLTSELVSNAVRHAGLSRDDTIRLHVDADRDWVHVDVCEAGPGLEDPFHARSTPGGWGLVLVAQLADRWGSTRDGGESCVWFEVGPPPGGASASPNA
jgi:anti-sigma regulatory factor (Ser/Thr protein kinase)